MSDSLPPMTDEALAAIEARLGAVGDRPWSAEHEDYGDEWWFGGSNGPGQNSLYFGDADAGVIQGDCRAEAELIANAPTDLRRLLDEVKRLRGELADFRQMAVLNSKAATEAVDRARSECAALAAKVAELEGESRLVQARAAGWDEGYKAGCESDPDSLLPGNNPYRDGSGMPHTPTQEPTTAPDSEMDPFEAADEMYRRWE